LAFNNNILLQWGKAETGTFDGDWPIQLPLSYTSTYCPLVTNTRTWDGNWSTNEGAAKAAGSTNEHSLTGFTAGVQTYQNYIAWMTIGY